MFWGREKELSEMQRLYNTENFQFHVIYGRRRVGKTTLINEFIKNKEAIYFTGIETNEKQNLENFSKSILGGDFSDSTPSFTNFQVALEYIFEKAITERIVLVIDEYPYVAKASKSLASILQLLIDKYKENSKLFIILCGSSMSYMEDQVLAYKAPLYGRRTAQFKIEPFEFHEAIQRFANFSPEDKAIAYGMVGGTPQYLMQLHDGLSLEDNMKQIFLTPSSFLFEEPLNLLKQELREPATYNAIISAIASGYSKMSEISTKVGESTNVCAMYLKNLIDLGIVKKEVPYNSKLFRKTIYSIEDNMFRFWYRFVDKNYSLISRGAKDIAYSRIEPHISTYMGLVFEEICKQYLWQLLLKGEAPIDFLDLGRWWGANPKTKNQEEIDIVGHDGDGQFLFAECKWTNEDIGITTLEKLVDRSELFEKDTCVLYLFAKRGFTEACKTRAEELGNVNLISYGDILSKYIK